MVYPSAVYLDNLEKANQNSPIKVANRSEVVTDEENFEDELNHSRTTSRAKITKKVALHDANSVSSLDTIKSEDHVMQQPQSRPRNSSESTVNSETAILTGSDRKIRKSYKKHGSYKISAGSKSGTASKKVLLEAAIMANTSNVSQIQGGSKKIPQKNDNQSQISQISSSREGSFRFLEHEEIEHTPTPRRAQSSALRKRDEDAASIQWSNNSDRLI